MKITRIKHSKSNETLGVQMKDASSIKKIIILLKCVSWPLLETQLEHLSIAKICVTSFVNVPLTIFEWSLTLVTFFLSFSGRQRFSSGSVQGQKGEAKSLDIFHFLQIDIYKFVCSKNEMDQ